MSTGTIIDIFHSDPFSAVEMTTAVERLPHIPAFLRDLGIFTPNPIRTTALAVEERNGILTVVPTSQRGQQPLPALLRRACAQILPFRFRRWRSPASSRRPSSRASCRPSATPCCTTGSRPSGSIRPATS